MSLPFDDVWDYYAFQPKLQRSLGFQPEYSREIPTGKMPMLRLETEPSIIALLLATSPGN